MIWEQKACGKVGGVWEVPFFLARKQQPKKVPLARIDVRLEPQTMPCQVIEKHQTGINVQRVEKEDCGKMCRLISERAC